MNAIRQPRPSATPSDEQAARMLARTESLGQIGSVEIDLVSRSAVWSDHLYDIYGRDRELGPAGLDEFLTYIHPADRAVADILRAQEERGVELGPTEFRILRGDGSVRWIHREVAIERDANQRPVRMSATEQDVTARKDVEAELHALAERLTLAQHVGRIGSLVIDLIGQTHFRSDEFYRLVGLDPAKGPYTRAEIFAHIHPDDRRKVVSASDLSHLGLAAPDVEFRVSREDGWAWLRRTQDIVFDEAGKPKRVVVCLQDITDRMRQIEEITAQKERAEKASLARSQFLANMSHEIRTPMNGILGVARILEDANLADEERKHVDIIRHSAEYLMSIINEILDFSKLESSSLKINRHTFRLRGAFTEQLDMMAYLAAEKGLELTNEIGQPVPNFVVGDRDRFCEVLTNLVGNAIKYTPSGRVAVRMAAVADARADIRRIRVEIADTGPGIPEDAHGRLFEPFFQVSSGSTKTSPGTGLGLTIAKRICELMGGQIGFDSTLGHGTTFWFEIPFAAATQADIAKIAKQRQQRVEKRFGAANILVAEDVASNQFVISKLLQGLDCRFDIASNGAEAVARAAERHYDAILMDCHMPAMDGFEATRRIRAQETRRNVIIALTANVMAEDRDRCLDSGMDEVIHKPLAKGDLVVALNKFLAGHDAPGGGEGHETAFADEPAMDAALADFGADAGELIRLTLREADQFLSDLAAAQARADGDAVALIAHSMKSILRQVGAESAGDLAREIEALARRDDAASIGAKIDALRSVYAATRRRLEKRI
jgi:signal transduction histidine kinase/DNA-binding response OmpR family regulator